MADEKTKTEGNASSLKAGTILKAVYAALVVIVFLFTAYHGLNSYIDSKIETRISNPDFLRKLARTMRPSLVFDEKGSILADMGAVPLLDKISVTKGTKEGSFEIVISPLEYLPVEPVLEALDGDYTILADRGKKFDWTFRLQGIGHILWEEHPPQRDKERFRLELIR